MSIVARLCRALVWVFLGGVALADANACAGKKRDFGDGTDATNTDPSLMSSDDDRESDLPAPSNPDGSGATESAGDEELSTPGGVVIGPRLAVAPTSLDLGAIVVDLAAVRAATVSNTGDQVLPVPTVALVGGSGPLVVLAAPPAQRWGGGGLDAGGAHAASR